MAASAPSVSLSTVSLPKIWLGLIFVVIPFVLIFAVPGPQEIRQEVSFRFDSATGQYRPVLGKDLTPAHPMVPYAAAAVVLGWAFWLYSLYRLHAALARADASYPVSPARAAFFHLIPLFNLYWVFAWTKSLSKLAGQRSIIISKVGPGIALCFSLVIAYTGLIPPSGVLAHALALAITLFTGMYLFSRAARVLAAAPD